MKNCEICASEHKRNRTNFCSIKCTLIGKSKKNENECWEWQGSKSGDGYGAIKEKNSRKQTSTHRKSYEEFKGEISNGLLVCHSCDNILCCNPDHLFLGTAKENTVDSIKKARWSKVFFDQNGSKNISAKFNEELVREIKILFKKGWMTRDVANLLGIHHKRLEDIKYGKTWRHVLLE
jgi:hypothetical protein